MFRQEKSYTEPIQNSAIEIKGVYMRSEAIYKLIEKINNNNTKQNRFTQAEQDFLCDALRIFRFLITYSVEEDESSLNKLAIACKEKSFFLGSMMKDGADAEDYDNPLFKDFIKSPSIKSLKLFKKNIGNFYDMFNVYEKRDKVIDCFLKIEPANELYNGNIRTSSKILANFRFPTICSKEKTEALLKSLGVVKIKENLYKVHLSVFTSNLIYKRELSRYIIDYLLIDGQLVAKEFFDNGTYEEYKNLQEKQPGFMVVKKDGSIDENYDAGIIMKKLRDCIAGHEEFSACNIVQSNFICRNLVFITNESEPRAIVVDDLFLNVMHQMVDYDDEQASDWDFVLTPKIHANQSISEYLSNLYHYTVIPNKDEDKSFYIAVIYRVVNGYKAYDYIDNEEVMELLKEGFPKATIESHKICNTELIKKLLPQGLGATNDESCRLIKKSLNFLFNFYDKNIYINEDIFKINGDTKGIAIQKSGMQNLISEAIGIITDDTPPVSKNKNLKTNLLLLQEREAQLFICYFIAYLNLIQNRFAEDIEDNLAQEVLKALDFSKFTFIPKFKNKNGRYRKGESLEDKMLIVKAIRNAISHFDLSVEVDVDGNGEKSLLSFSSPSKGGGYYIKATIKDFLEAITKKELCEYKEYENLSFETLDDFLVYLKTKFVEM